MYAVKGRSWRAVANGAKLYPGEVLMPDLPQEVLEPDPELVTRGMITAWLDQVVQAKGYDNIVSCASYAASTNDQFRAEAEAAIAWRDAVYAKGYEILADTPEGVDTPEKVMALLPKPHEFGWPED